MMSTKQFPACVTIYASSSGKIHQDYFDHAAKLGAILGQNKIDIVYGGGGTGTHLLNYLYFLTAFFLLS